ncbi:hypothetical protein EOL06_03955 [Escherichia coli]|nr:hypothetical protein EOL06_03955 [Escherichia coli]
MKNKNKNGTYDYGAFQINTIWANKLASDFGVKAEQLQHDFCASAMASAYILKYNLGPTCARTDTLTPSSYCCH